MVNGLECRSQDSQVIPNQACRFRNFFLGPIPELFSASVSSHFQEIGKIMSTQLTRHYFLHFQELHEIMSTKTQTWHSWLKCGKTLAEKSYGMGPRKKFRNLQAWLEMTWLFCNLHSKPLTKYFPPLEAATAADLAQAFEPGLRRLRQQPT